MAKFPKLPVSDCSGVYIIINKVNGKKYIGSSCMVERRIIIHFKFKGSVVLAYAIKKYGPDNFEAFILEKKARKQLPKCEGKWIQKLKPEYNLTTITKTGGRIVAPESIAKSVAGRAGYTHAPETRIMMGNSNRGKKRTKAQRKRISDGLKASPYARANILKLIDMHRGKKQSPERIEKRVAPLRGRKMKPKSKKACKAARKQMKEFWNALTTEERKVKADKMTKARVEKYPDGSNKSYRDNLSNAEKKVIAAKMAGAAKKFWNGLSKKEREAFIIKRAKAISDGCKRNKLLRAKEKQK